MDPTYGGYITDQNGRALSGLECRKRMAKRKPVQFVDYQYHNEPLPEGENLEEYYAKNLFQLRWVQDNGFHMIRSDNLVLLALPSGYDRQEQALANLEYARGALGDHPILKDAEEKQKKERVILVDPEKMY